MNRINVNHISKCYTKRNNKDQETIWALSDISFEVESGESIGIFGDNGSGKSTLLSLLAGHIKPTGGKGMINGKVAALLGIGSGFHPDLTGEENYYLKGQILNVPKKELTSRYSEMLEFSELSDFIKEPIKTYSSGMFMRLAFSTAIFSKADIFLIDEVLAVGDMDFRQKCYDKIEQLKEQGATLLIVSHNIQEIQTICDRFLILRNGKLLADTKQQHELIRVAYKSYLSVDRTHHHPYIIEKKVQLHALLINGHNINDDIVEDEPIDIRIHLKLLQPLTESHVMVMIIKHQMESPVFSINTVDLPEFNDLISNPEVEEVELSTTIPPGLIQPGIFAVTLILQSKHYSHRVQKASIFLIRESPSVRIAERKNINSKIDFEVKGKYASSSPNPLNK